MHRSLHNLNTDLLSAKTIKQNPDIATDTFSNRDVNIYSLLLSKF